MTMGFHWSAPRACMRNCRLLRRKPKLLWGFKGVDELLSRLVLYKTWLGCFVIRCRSGRGHVVVGRH